MSRPRNTKQLQVDTTAARTIDFKKRAEKHKGDPLATVALFDGDLDDLYCGLENLEHEIPEFWDVYADLEERRICPVPEEVVKKTAYCCRDAQRKAASVYQNDDDVVELCPGCEDRICYQTNLQYCYENGNLEVRKPDHRRLVILSVIPGFTIEEVRAAVVNAVSCLGTSTQVDLCADGEVVETYQRPHEYYPRGDVIHLNLALEPENSVDAPHQYQTYDAVGLAKLVQSLMAEGKWESDA